MCCWVSGVWCGQIDYCCLMIVLDLIWECWLLCFLFEWMKCDVYYYMQENNFFQYLLFEQGYFMVGDWYFSGLDVGDLSGCDICFGGLKQECGIYLFQEVNEGLMGEGI